MNCKKCQAELENGVTVCPECGTDNAIQSKPEPKTITITPGKLALAIAVVVVLTAMFVALIVSGLNAGQTAAPVETGTTDPVETTVPATSPADTGLDDETCKGSYTTSDESVAAARDTVVATLGSAELTNGDLQVFYWMEVSGFYSQYYYYASMLGLDFSQPLDTQMCMLVETPVTWQQYFLCGAINNWLNYQALALEAGEEGFTVSDETRQMLDSFQESFAEEAKTAGYEDVSLYVYDNLGAGADLLNYNQFLELMYTGGEYFDMLCAAIEPTEDEVIAYFDTHAEEYAANGLTKDSCTVDVRHILVFPEGATIETIRTQTFPEEAWAAGKAQAEQILAQWEEGDKTEESFAAFANEHSADPGSNTNGGLYTEIGLGEMVQNFEDWCFDANRQIGDYGIVQTELGFHIMYFSGKNYIWPQTARADLSREISSEILTGIVEKYELDVDYASIQIGTAGVFKGIDTDNTPAEEETPEAESGMDPLVIVLIAAGAVLVIAVGALLILRKKKETPAEE